MNLNELLSFGQDFLKSITNNNVDMHARFHCSCDEMYKVIDTSQGDTICSNCGVVCEERSMSYQNEFDENDNPIFIQSSKSEFYENKTLSTIMSKKMGLMSVLHIHTSTNQKESYRQKEFIEIERLCELLKTTVNIANVAKHKFHDLNKIKTFRGPNRKAMIACCILQSLSENKVTRTLTEMSEALGIDKSILTKNVKIYENIFNVKLFNERYSNEIYRHVQGLGVLRKDVFKISNVVIQKHREMIQLNEYQGRSPKVLLAIILKDMKFDKHLISKILKVSITAF
jgi:transcription initiation factor TFIIIB Brf1 subunit/transcription initiation factor TFIIB